MEVVASTTIIFSIHDPEEISAMITQASEDIQNKLTSQGDKLKNQLSNTFGFNELQSQFSLGYQYALAGIRREQFLVLRWQMKP